MGDLNEVVEVARQAVATQTPPPAPVVKPKSVKAPKPPVAVEPLTGAAWVAHRTAAVAAQSAKR